MKITLISLVLLVSCTAPFIERTPAQSSGRWPQWSGDIHNNHNLTPISPEIGRQNVRNLKTLWTFPTTTSVVSTPTSVDGTIYFTDISRIGVGGLFTGGSLFAVNAATGEKIWSKKVESYTKHYLRDFSRSSPAISGDRLFIGDSINNLKFIARSLVSYSGLPGSSVIAVDRHTGKLLWKTNVESHFASRITMSPIVYQGKVIVGVSSMESEIPAVRGILYKCCTFKGSVVALDEKTGKILWKTHTIDPKLSDVSGAPVWGSSPPIDKKRNRLYIGTGNNYHNSAKLLACLKKNPDLKACAAQTDSAENRFDSIVSMDLNTGKIIWTKKTVLHDAWNIGCGSPFNSSIPGRNVRVCPAPEGKDADFAQAPMFIPAEKNELGMDVLAIGQKNGMFWVLEAESGKTIWSKQVGPGGKLGGHQWGSATDGKRIYFQTTNMEHTPVTMQAGLFRGTTIRGGYWGALDLKTGNVLWETPDPSTKYPLTGEGIFHVIYGTNLGRGYFASAMGPLTYYNELLFVGSLSGEMLALDARNGKVLWSYMAKGSVVGAPSIVNDVLYWGTGYHMGVEDNKVYAIGL